MKRNSKDVFVPIPRGFKVSTPLNNLGGDEFMWEPSGLYLTFRHERAEIHYAGEKAGQSGIQFDIPASPDFLRKFAKEMNDKADELEKQVSEGVPSFSVQ